MSLTEQQQKDLEDTAKKSAQNMGAPKDLWHNVFGWIILNGVVTREGEFFLKVMLEEKMK